MKETTSFAKLCKYVRLFSKYLSLQCKVCVHPVITYSKLQVDDFKGTGMCPRDSTALRAGRAERAPGVPHFEEIIYISLIFT